jgi:putative aldouronate transport system permease protein
MHENTALKKQRRIRATGSDLVFDIVVYCILGLITLIIAYPLYFVIIGSISDPVAINSGQTCFCQRASIWIPIGRF